MRGLVRPTTETTNGDDFVYPAVKVDRVLRDGGTIKMGDLILTAYLTPGHKRGATTWVADVVDGGKSYVVVFPDGGGFNPGLPAGEGPLLPRHRRRLSQHASPARDAEARMIVGRSGMP